MKETYYRISIDEVKPDDGFHFNSVRTCICCRQIVDSHGHGNNYICDYCKHIVESGVLASVFDEIKSIVQSGKLPTERNRL